MPRLFQPISAKPAFGVLQNNSYASDYIQKKKLRQLLSSSVKNQKSTNITKYNSSILNNCEIYNNIVYNKFFFNKTDLVAGLYSKENLNGVITLSGITQTQSVTISPSINPTIQPFYYYYTIDPNGELFGNTQCGINNYTNFMQVSVPIIKSSTTIESCASINNSQCNSQMNKICNNICSNNQVSLETDITTIPQIDSVTTMPPIDSVTTMPLIGI